jgi:hypothetical protein
MLSTVEHLDDLVRHISKVRDACLLLGEKYITRGQAEFGRIVIARGFRHDVSKFHGIEWEYLHAGEDIPKEKIDLAIRQHQQTNDHHPEYWGGMEHMPRVAVAEMVCDWYARSQEFASDLRRWVEDSAIDRYQIDPDGEVFKWINEFLDVLVQKPFSRTPEAAVS